MRYRPPVGWWDLLDIAIVSILIYEFLKLIRGTRAVQMAVGSLFIVGLFYISQLAPLQTAELDDPQRAGLRGVRGHRDLPVRHPPRARALRPGAVLPLLQPPGGGRTRRSRRSSSRPACWPRSSTGAIIAIEREIGLRNYIESGIPLDAELTYDLLVTIFQPASPLHDGAVILQENRVAAAACFLPLTVNPRVSRELGTRHRAAIGLTEENDAIAVVVSEETRPDRAGDRRRHRARPDARPAARSAARRCWCSAGPARGAPAAPAYDY